MNKATIPTDQEIQYDVVIIGAGISGITALYHLRKIGLRCLIIERGGDIGGVWYWNRYPGARTDSGIPSYLVNIPECWQTWEWTSDFPSHLDMRRYIDHCDRQIRIREHVRFNTTVTGTQFDRTSRKWVTLCVDGTLLRSKYLVLAVGCTSARSSLMDKHLKPFQGDVYFPCEWPHHDVSPVGKDVAVIGTGSSGVQIVQNWGSRTKSLTVYQRSYNTAIPMSSTPIEAMRKEFPPENYGEFIMSRLETPSGIVGQKECDKDTMEDTPENRNRFYQSLFNKGGLSYWISSYRDITLDPTANRLAYDFWAKTTREKIRNPRKRDILAPLEPTHPFGVKRPALDNGYFEQFNRDSVDVIDLRTNPISHFNADGIVMMDGTHHHHDIIIPAIGFTAVTDNVTRLGIKDPDGTPIRDLWADEVRTHLGMMHHRLPNMFMLCGPQAPSEQVNVPTCIDVQIQWISRLIHIMEDKKLDTIRPTKAAMELWNEKVYGAFKREFYSTVTCRYTKVGKPSYYNGGIPRYIEALESSYASLEEFEFTKRAC